MKKKCYFRDLKKNLRSLSNSTNLNSLQELYDKFQE